jgi:uncharacterized protein
MIKNGLISQSTFIFKYNKNESILYNSFNSSIILIENDKLDNNFEKLNNEEFNSLKKMGFMMSNEGLKKEVISTYNNFNSNTLDIIIEFTKNCNLDCVYCYQKNWNVTLNITKKTIDNIIIYIENCFLKKKFKKLVVNFFGGEPLLVKDKLLYAYEKLNILCKKYNVELFIGIDTNGTLLDKSFIANFEKVHFSIPLTTKEDHDKKRALKKNGSSYDIIFNNLLSVKDLFMKENYTLSIRCNIDHDNIDTFDLFLETLINNGLKFSVETSYTYEQSYTNYKNLLSFEEFKKWNSSKAIDILIKHNLRIKQKPNIMITPCTAYTGYNIKIYSNGILSLCSGDYPNNKNNTINDIKNNIEMIKEIFPEKSKKINDDLICLGCKDLLLCGGQYFCRRKKCEYSNIDLCSFLRTYIKYSDTQFIENFDFKT